MLGEARDSFRRMTNIIANDRATESMACVEKLAEVAFGLAESIVVQIREVVQNIGIDQRLMHQESLREAQFCSLLLQAHSAADKTLDSPNREIVPPKLNKLRDTLAAVMAIAADRISAGATGCESLFAKSGVLPQARKIEAMAWEIEDDPDAGSGTNRLFGEVAALLGVSDWYDWAEVDGGENFNQAPELP